MFDPSWSRSTVELRVLMEHTISYFTGNDELDRLMREKEVVAGVPQVYQKTLAIRMTAVPIRRLSARRSCVICTTGKSIYNC